MRLTFITVFAIFTLVGVAHINDAVKELQQEVNHLRQDISRYEAMRSECAPAEDIEP